MPVWGLQGNNLSQGLSCWTHSYLGRSHRSGKDLHHQSKSWLQREEEKRHCYPIDGRVAGQPASVWGLEGPATTPLCVWKLYSRYVEKQPLAFYGWSPLCCRRHPATHAAEEDTHKEERKKIDDGLGAGWLGLRWAIARPGRPLASLRLCLQRCLLTQVQGDDEGRGPSRPIVPK